MRLRIFWKRFAFLKRLLSRLFQFHLKEHVYFVAEARTADRWLLSCQSNQCDLITVHLTFKCHSKIRRNVEIYFVRKKYKKLFFTNFTK